MATSTASTTKAITKRRTRCRPWPTGSTGRAGSSGSFGRSAVRSASSSRVTATAGMRALNEHVVHEPMLSNEVVVPAALPDRSQRRSAGLPIP
jgi:hypothetical protein